MWGYIFLIKSDLLAYALDSHPQTSSISLANFTFYDVLNILLVIFFIDSLKYS